ncbi:MAG TPA: hypothetical protein VHC22_16965 [Pirellulales bacterium]|nr:hypothetical protein [Pirellulales bacterium]
MRWPSRGPTRGLAEVAPRLRNRLVLAGLLWLVMAGAGWAQVVGAIRIGVDANLTDEQWADVGKQYTHPLRECLPLELRFLQNVCELDHQQVASLEQDGRAAIDALGEEFAVQLRRQVANNGLKRRVVAIRGAAVPVANGFNVVVAGGKLAAVPNDFGQDGAAAPSRTVRRELAKIVQGTWPDAWRKYDVEQRRLEAFRKRARAQIQVALVDEVLLLSDDQRRDLGEKLIDDPLPLNDGAHPAVDPTEQLFWLTGDEAYLREVPTAILDAALTARQSGAYRQMMDGHHEVVFVQKAVMVPVAVQGANQAAPIQQMARVERRIVRRGPAIEDLRRLLMEHLQLRIDDVHAACGLTDAQREKLLLAGKLDIGQLMEQRAALPQNLAEGEKIVVQKVNATGGIGRTGRDIFGTATSSLQKTLQGRLCDDQKRRLMIAERERRELQRRSLVDAVVVGFERAAALTSQQCVDLSTALNNRLVEGGDAAEGDWRIESVRRIATLPDEWWHPYLYEEQWPAIGSRQALLIEEIRQVDTRPQAPVPAAGGGMF